MKIWVGNFNKEKTKDYEEMRDVNAFIIEGSNVRKKYIVILFYIFIQYEKNPVSKKELHSKLDEKGFERKTILLNNKIDIEQYMTDSNIIKNLNLEYALL